MLIQVVEYQASWADEFEKEERVLQYILQKELVRSFHIGSTSVPGLKAKPIIDILLVVQDIEYLDSFSKNFEDIGYEVMGEFGMEGRRYFRKGGESRTHQIHAFQFDQIVDIERHVVFRDYLREHPEVCREYGTLKAQLAKQFPSDIQAYSEGKNDFVKKVEREALKWRWSIR